MEFLLSNLLMTLSTNTRPMRHPYLLSLNRQRTLEEVVSNIGIVKICTTSNYTDVYYMKNDDKVW